MKCQKNKACVKQPANALPDDRPICTGCNIPSKESEQTEKRIRCRDDFYEACDEYSLASLAFDRAKLRKEQAERKLHLAHIKFDKAFNL